MVSDEAGLTVNDEEGLTATGHPVESRESLTVPPANADPVKNAHSANVLARIPKPRPPVRNEAGFDPNRPAEEYSLRRDAQNRKIRPTRFTQEGLPCVL